MFTSPQCTLGGELLDANVTPISAVYCDPSGAVWAVDASGTRVFHFSASAVADAIASASALSGASFLGVAASESSAVPRFECGEGDHVVGVVFLTTRPASPAVACIATAEGRLVLADPAGPVGGLRQCDLSTPLTAVAPVSVDEAGAAAENGPGVLVSSFDGTFSEVVFVEWEGEDEAEEVRATGLFRIRGCLQSVILDGGCERILTITQRGDVDVWNWRKGFDETLSFGMPAYSVDDYGAPSCSILLSGGQLWVGTVMGYIVAFALKPGASDGSPRHVWQAHRDAASVQSLLVMSLGRHVWSYAADGQALVWDAAAWTLQGSFQFPGDAVSTLHSGPSCVDTVLWATCTNSGAVTWFTVKEPLLRAEKLLSLDRGGCIVRLSDVERLHVLEALVSHLCLQLAQTEAADEEAEPSRHAMEEGEGGHETVANMTTPPHLDVALQQLGEDYPTARQLPPALASLVVGRRMVRRSLADAGVRARSFLEDIQLLLQEHRRHRGLQAQVQRCLAELRQELQPGEACDTLEDVVDTVRALARRMRDDSLAASTAMSSSERNHRTSSRARSGSAQDTSAMVSPPAGAGDGAAARRLEEDLRLERQRRERSEAQLAEVYDEKRELQRQLTQSTRQQEAYEERLLSLERLLATAKKAAAVKTAEAARFSEMEASLHEAHHTIDTLQAKLETLMRGRQESLHTAKENKSLHAELHTFEVKEQLARRAFASFIETQDFVLDRLSNMLQHADVDGDGPHAVSSLYEWLCGRVETQHAFLVGLKRDYTRQRAKDAA
ncbi:uncharacterized protein Tco025E_01737 [Trypanosoma conorhini]|uniref:Wd40 repeat domain-containing protein n=1 Tax=Trypanosoma conorhini TaxID=83891 RepID=A0A3R7LF53_9TRYP|nr:uncharacterized protein Tco025E_01737 [Trypanosoma conorhini]RNF26032.1 hypothetical protein Tco025E_01737 [Trypanosoma conorhini]